MTLSRCTLTQKRILQSGLALCLLLALSGCVYLRLLSFKNQLKQFDKYVVVDDDQGLGLQLKDPVLEDQDFVYITESEPTEIRSISSKPLIEDWIWRFEKEGDEDNAAPFSVIFRTRFEDHLLTRIDFDPQIIEIIPPDFVVAMFKSMGKAKISKLRRSATSEMSRDALTGVPLPTMLDIEHVMGEPTRNERRDERLVWSYTFNFFNPQSSDLSGQFKIAFKSDGADLGREIAGFEVMGKAR